MQGPIWLMILSAIFAVTSRTRDRLYYRPGNIFLSMMFFSLGLFHFVLIKFFGAYY